MDPDLMKLMGVLAYMGVLVGIGVVASRRMKDVKDYFAAGKRLSFWSVAFSARATGESAWLLLGLTGMGAVLGLKAFWVVLGEVLGVGVAWILMSRRFHRLTMHYEAITIPDYLERRFGDQSQRIRLVAAFALTVFVTIYVSAQIDATGAAFESFLGWNYTVGALVGFGIVLAYIVSGGFLAVAWSDVFQGTLMVLGLVLLPVVGWFTVGGWSEISTRLAAADPALLTASGAGGWSLENVLGIIGLALIGLGFMGSPQIFARFLALRDEREIKAGTTVALVWTLLADSGAVLTGVIGRALLVDADAELVTVLGEGGEAVLPMLVEHLFPLLLVGLYIAVVLSAIMSTVDSLLVLASSAAVRDWYQKVRHPDIADDALVPMCRKATFILALFALAIALTVAQLSPTRTVFWFVIFGWSGIAATFCPTMILSLFWRKMTARGALAAMISGFFAVPFFKFVAPKMEVVGPWFSALSELPPSFAISMLCGVVFSLLDRNGQERLPEILRDCPGVFESTGSGAVDG